MYATGEWIREPGDRSTALFLSAVLPEDRRVALCRDVFATPPAHGWSVSLDAIVEGRTTLAEQVEAARLDQAVKALRHRAALEAFMELPA